MSVGGADASVAAGDDLAVWYFAYGSNLSPEKRRRRAGISELDTRPARVAGWRLAFDMPGIPPAEPSMANLRSADGEAVHGVLIKMSTADFAALTASEGGAHFYEVCELVAESYDGERILARAFVASERRRRSHERPPSLRYMRLLREGAREAGLDAAYCAFLDALPTSEASPLARLCSALVLEVFTEAARSQLHDAANHYLALLQATDDLSPLPRAAAQGALLAPALAAGLGIRALSAIRRR